MLQSKFLHRCTVTIDGRTRPASRNCSIFIADASLPNDQCKEVLGPAGAQTEIALSAAPTTAVPYGQRVRLQEGAEAQQMRIQRTSGAQVQKGAYLIDQLLIFH